MIVRRTVFNFIKRLPVLIILILVLNNAYIYAADKADYRDIFSDSERDIKKRKLIVPGQSVGFLIVGKPIPHSFIEFYGEPDSYYEPGATMDSGSMYWENKLLIKLNDLKNKKNIFSIFVEDPVFKTAKGIGVLSTFKDLKKKYPKGKEYVDDFRGQTAWELKGITFFITDSGVVSEIFISNYEGSYK
jgi:hypothetical protein